MKIGVVPISMRICLPNRVDKSFNSLLASCMDKMLKEVPEKFFEYMKEQGYDSVSMAIREYGYSGYPYYGKPKQCSMHIFKVLIVFTDDAIQLATKIFLWKVRRFLRKEVATYLPEKVGTAIEGSDKRVSITLSCYQGSYRNLYLDIDDKGVKELSIPGMRAVRWKRDDGYFR